MNSENSKKKSIFEEKKKFHSRYSKKMDPMTKIQWKNTLSLEFLKTPRKNAIR